MKFVVTIDTEEDQWSDYYTIGHSLENIKEISELQLLFEEFNVRPTYLVSYPVAADACSISILKPILKADKCEIGSHCHPWNTPPFVEKLTPKNTMLCNLSSNLQLEKLKNLTEIITQNFGVRPVSFRAGRWGFDTSVARNLSRLDYQIDSSVTPFITWERYHGPNFEEEKISPNYIKFENESPSKTIYEIPVTIGFNQNNFTKSFQFEKKYEQWFVTKKLLLGILHRTGFLKKIWLSPELNSAEEMINLIKKCQTNKYSIVNLMFHSNSLKPGLTPFVKSIYEKQHFMKKMTKVLTFIREKGIASVTLKEYYLQQLSDGAIGRV